MMIVHIYGENYCDTVRPFVRSYIMNMPPVTYSLLPKMSDNILVRMISKKTHKLSQVLRYRI